jgi:hypothetical protein
VATGRLVLRLDVEMLRQRLDMILSTYQARSAMNAVTASRTDTMARPTHPARSHHRSHRHRHHTTSGPTAPAAIEAVRFLPPGAGFTVPAGGMPTLADVQRWALPTAAAVNALFVVLVLLSVLTLDWRSRRLHARSRPA